MTGFLRKVVDWLRAGYPEGVPSTDYLPLFALLSRQLTDTEVKTVAHEMLSRPDFDDADIGAEILRVSDELPALNDVERVRGRLAAFGWPLDERGEATS